MSSHIHSDVYGIALAALIVSVLAAATGVAAFAVVAVTTRPAAAQEIEHRYPQPASPRVTATGLRMERGARVHPGSRAPLDPNGNGVTFSARTPEHCAPFAVRAELERIAAACGAVDVISTYRANAHVRGTHRPSLHRFCQSDIGAADFRVRNYACARRELATWSGGQSTDPFGVGHLHISIGGHEGIFRHHGRRRK